MSKMKIAIAGANGRMGHMLIEAVLKADDAVLTGALDVPDSPNPRQRRRYVSRGENRSYS